MFFLSSMSIRNMGIVSNQSKSTSHLVGHHVLMFGSTILGIRVHNIPHLSIQPIYIYISHLVGHHVLMFGSTVLGIRVHNIPHLTLKPRPSIS